MGERLTEVGAFDETINILLGTDASVLPICVSMKGLRTHLIKHKHFDCLRHLADLSDIISSPDYVGVSPNEANTSFEYVKKFDKNIQIGIKL